jgi:CubicO group peptidase (beta-lactamase class C family)
MGLATDVSAITQRAIRDEHVPGASVAIVHDGRVVFVRGYGERDVERRLPVDEHTRFMIASVTKQIVAVDVLRLVERGRLTLDEKIGTFFGPSPAAGVTIADLLDQHSGIHDYNSAAVAVPALLHGNVSPSALGEAVLARPLGFAPGAQFDYSNANYLLLGLIDERVTGEPLAQRLAREYFTPLGMHDTALEPFAPCAGDNACGYTKTPLGVRAIPAVPFAFAWSAGGVVSTAADLARWDVALMSGRLLGPDMLARMTSSARDGEYADAAFVYRTTRGRTVAWHDGTIAGFKAMNAITMPERDAVVVLANADYAHAPALAMELQNALFDEPGGAAEPVDLRLPQYAYPLALGGGLLAGLAALALLRKKTAAVIAAVLVYALAVFFV